MVSLLLKADRSTDVSQWSFYSNRPGEIQNRIIPMTVEFSVAYMQGVWPLDL